MVYNRIRDIKTKVGRHYVLSLIHISFLFAGAMTAGGFLDGILAWMKTFVKGVGSLTLACVLATLMVAIVAGNA